MESVLARLGLPQEFGLTLLLLGLALLLAPWVSGVDFGFLKIPTFPDGTRRVLRIAGPVAFLLALFMHIPFLIVPPPRSNTEVASPDPRDSSSASVDKNLSKRDLRDLIVAFGTSIPHQVETSVGLRQYWSSLTDDCTMVLRERQFDPTTVTMRRLDTYTIDFSNVWWRRSGHASDFQGLHSVSLKVEELS